MVEIGVTAVPLYQGSCSSGDSQRYCNKTNHSLGIFTVLEGENLYFSGFSGQIKSGEAIVELWDFFSEKKIKENK